MNGLFERMVQIFGVAQKCSVQDTVVNDASVIGASLIKKKPSLIFFAVTFVKNKRILHEMTEKASKRREHQTLLGFVSQAHATLAQFASAAARLTTRTTQRSSKNTKKKEIKEPTNTKAHLPQL